MKPALKKNKFSIKTFFFVLACVAMGGLIPQFLTYSSTNSLGERFFVMWPVVGQPHAHPGDYVRFLHADAITEHKSLYMLKRVGCAAGQTLDVTPEGYLCDGKWLGVAKSHSAKGVPVTAFKWSGKVPDGYFFASAPHKDSYDSRYYGFVAESRVTAKAWPLF